MGDTITAWPSVRSSRVERLVTCDGDIDVAFAPMSVTVVLEDELDISRGDMITDGHVHMGHRFQADVVWMDERPLEPNRLYVIKHSSGTTTAQLDTRLMLNDIGKVTVDTSRALIFDKYSEHARHGRVHHHRADDELHGRRGDDLGGALRQGEGQPPGRGRADRAHRALGAFRG